MNQKIKGASHTGMKKFPVNAMKRKLKIACSAAIAATYLSISGCTSDVQAVSNNNANNNSQNNAVINIEGVAVTGFNRRLSEPLWDIGAPFGSVGFNFLFGYNDQGGSTPFDLTDSTPLDTLVASGFDPAFGALFPTPDPELLNIPLRDVAVIVSDDRTRAQVPGVLDAPGFAVTKSAPNDPITLDDWLKAEGTLRIDCKQDGTSEITVTTKNLVVNGVYTLWGVFALDFDADGVDDAAIPIALGGVPNAMVVDKSGKAEITRILSFCPQDEPSLKTVAIAFHSDGNIYGGVPELGTVGFPGGTITHDQLNFPVNVVGPAN